VVALAPLRQSRRLPGERVGGWNPRLALASMGRPRPLDLEIFEELDIGGYPLDHVSEGGIVCLRASVEDLDQMCGICSRPERRYPVSLPCNLHPAKQNHSLGEGSRCQEAEGERVHPNRDHLGRPNYNPAARPLEGDAADQPSLSGVEAGVRLEVVPASHDAITGGTEY